VVVEGKEGLGGGEEEKGREEKGTETRKGIAPWLLGGDRCP